MLRVTDQVLWHGFVPANKRLPSRQAAGTKQFLNFFLGNTEQLIIAFFEQFGANGTPHKDSCQHNVIRTSAFVFFARKADGQTISTFDFRDHDTEANRVGSDFVTLDG